MFQQSLIAPEKIQFFDCLHVLLPGNFCLSLIIKKRIGKNVEKIITLYFLLNYITYPPSLIILPFPAMDIMLVPKTYTSSFLYLVSLIFDKIVLVIFRRPQPTAKDYAKIVWHQISENMFAARNIFSLVKRLVEGKLHKLGLVLYKWKIIAYVAVSAHSSNWPNRIGTFSPSKSCKVKAYLS